MAIFPTFFFRQYRHGNFFYDFLERKDAFLEYKYQKFKKVKNWHFFKGVNPWFWSKNFHFSHFFLCIIGQENVFDDILERKNAFLGFKNKNFKKSKNWLFSKGLVHGFGQKVKMWPCFCFSQNKAQNMYDNVLETKKMLSRQ